ncbi:GAF domain-containing sensor histidine kinase [Falsiroseomonas sp. E2-1-a4]|uniref:GAF domain-containing sensor histidine kinase n=1 Tax=Falsiroseomonas sp. E2-1-a4 TaxID=3239299 RepID=UPI003F3699E1
MSEAKRLINHRPELVDVELIARIRAVPHILDVICSTTGLGFAVVARVTESRWVACEVKDHLQFGLTPGGELDVRATLCQAVRQHREVVVMDDADSDPVYQGHPVPAQYGFRSYISVPILLPDGRFFGTLCGLDPAPRKLSTHGTIGMFRLFAEMIGFQIEVQERLAAREAELREERELAELREQFVAVLGHDLRNPLASIDSCLRMLDRGGLEARPAELVRLGQSSVRRMANLIRDLMDLARGQLQEGFPLALNEGAGLEASLRQVVAEVAAGSANCVIETEITLQEPVPCDPGRIAQLCSNLLANAATHGRAGAPVRLRALALGGEFRLSVSNEGEPIPPDTLAKLFQPYFRGGLKPNQQGLGLGLFISAEIARAHGGVLEVTSDPAETRFTFIMPCGEGGLPRSGGEKAPRSGGEKAPRSGGEKAPRGG